MDPTLYQDADASRGQGSDDESARDHALYKNAVPGIDGLFHCPWEGQPGCHHVPVKLKCIYDTFVDSHLKPYRCRVESCEGLRFSSTASRLRHERQAHGLGRHERQAHRLGRHERQAHGLHDRGPPPFLCSFEGCEHAVPGNGFHRKWQLRQHLELVHADNPLSASTAQLSAKGRKRKAESREPEVNENGESNGESGHVLFRSLESSYEDLLKDHQIYEKLFRILRTASAEESEQVFRRIRANSSTSPIQTDIEAAALVLEFCHGISKSHPTVY
ncbi:hypothetical protein G3M48_010356 [Beauveria asiatica]|uniref:C2H2-type domain-containing protein n=1 Tax=Beauveria asiatica TaxID=1069075 RepID=A0AAW0RHA5_9HYPO